MPKAYVLEDEIISKTIARSYWSIVVTSDLPFRTETVMPTHGKGLSLMVHRRVPPWVLPCQKGVAFSSLEEIASND